MSLQVIDFDSWTKTAKHSRRGTGGRWPLKGAPARGIRAYKEFIMFVLIVIYVSSISSIEFSSLDSCQKAEKVLNQNTTPGTLTVCVKK
jgi:hypothetical protein